MQNYVTLVLHLSNVLAVCLIAIHRFLGVVVSERVKIRKVHAYVMLGVAWLTTLIVAIFPASGFLSASVYTAGAHACSPDWQDSCSFFILMIIFLYGLALPTMSICYLLIIREIRKSEARLRKTKERPTWRSQSIAKYQNDRRISLVGDTSETNGGVDGDDIPTVSIRVVMTTNESEMKGKRTSSMKRDNWNNRRKNTQSRINLSADKRVALTCKSKLFEGLPK